MNWIINNERGPEKDGFYFTEDSDGLKRLTNFIGNHWHSTTGNPVARWVDEESPSFSLEDMKAVWDSCSKQWEDRSDRCIPESLFSKFMKDKHKIDIN